MKTQKAIRWLAGSMAVAALVATPAAFAGSKFLDACKSDFEKFHCNPGTDFEADKCVEKNMQSGLSRGCSAAHQDYEKNGRKWTPTAGGKASSNHGTAKKSK